MSSRLQNAMLIGEQKDTARIRWWVWCLLIFIVLALMAGFGTLVVLDAYSRGRAFEREKISMTPTSTCPVPAQALTQWSCTKQEAKEYLFACRTRERMGGVKGKEG